MEEKRKTNGVFFSEKAFRYFLIFVVVVLLIIAGFRIDELIDLYKDIA